MYRIGLSFAVGFVLAALLFGYRFSFAQSTVSDYLKKVEPHILAISHFNADGPGKTGKRLELYKSAQKYLTDTKPAKGFAAFHARALFATNYCVRAMQTNIEAEESGDTKNVFAAGVLLELNNSCIFASQDALTLWLQTKEE